jgi:hypothetical protein
MDKKKVMAELIKKHRDAFERMGCQCCCHHTDGHSCLDKGCEHCVEKETTK